MAVKDHERTLPPRATRGKRAEAKLNTREKPTTPSGSSSGSSSGDHLPTRSLSTELTGLSGIPTISVTRKAYRLSYEEMGRVMEVTAKTIERWEKQSSLPADSHKRHILAQLGEIHGLGTEVYTPDGFRSFMRTPLPVFGGLTALQMVQTGQGEAVIGALAADYEGAGY